MLSAGAAVAFFGHVFGENEVGFGEGLIGQGGQTVKACHGLGNALRDGLGYGVGDVFEPVQECGFGSVRRAAEPEHPKPNRMNVPVFKVVEIGSVGALVVVAVAVFARVFEPGFRIGFGGEHFALNYPRLARGASNGFSEPGAQASIPGLRLACVIAVNFPVAEHLSAPAGHQNLGDTPNKRADNIVTGQPAVTVRKLVVAAFVRAARGNDERRV